jgi:hypothetical protein
MEAGLLVPKLVTTLRSYSRQQLAADLTAGVIVGIVALPLAIAFAIASDVHAQPMVALGRSRLLGELGDENLLGSLDDALAAARAHLGLQPEGRGPSRTQP